MEYVISELSAVEQATAVIAEPTTWRAFPRLWPALLAEVWAAARGSDGRIVPGRNVMLYEDDVPNVQVGVEVAAPFTRIGRVVPGLLPAGRVAATTHRGSYGRLGDAHEAVIAWCDVRGLERAGPRWEIYGHAVESEADQEVEIYWLLR